MGSSYFRPNPPCANCGKAHGGIIGASEVNSGMACCSYACVKRLYAKFANGMDGVDHDPVSGQRIRIKVLSAQLRQVHRQLAALKAASP